MQAITGKSQRVTLSGIKPAVLPPHTRLFLVIQWCACTHRTSLRLPHMAFFDPTVKKSILFSVLLVSEYYYFQTQIPAKANSYLLSKSLKHFSNCPVSGLELFFF